MTSLSFGIWITILCIKHVPAEPAPAVVSRGIKQGKERALINDFTIAHNARLYQIEEGIRAKKLTVEERIDGSMHIKQNGKDLRYKEITDRPLKEKALKPLILKPRKMYIPPKDHPWRRYSIIRNMIWSLQKFFS